MTPNPIDLAISLAGGKSALARKVGVAASLPSMWKLRGNVPAEHCPAIERATAGRVRCEDLRPDVDWAYIRASATHPAASIPPSSPATHQEAAHG